MLQIKQVKTIEKELKNREMSNYLIREQSNGYKDAQ